MLKRLKSMFNRSMTAFQILKCAGLLPSSSRRTCSATSRPSAPPSSPAPVTQKIEVEKTYINHLLTPKHVRNGGCATVTAHEMFFQLFRTRTVWRTSLPSTMSKHSRWVARVLASQASSSQPTGPRWSAKPPKPPGATLPGTPRLENKHWF